MKTNLRQYIVFISGAYSGNNADDIADNIMKARVKAIELWEAGYTVLCPHLNTIHFENDCKCTYHDYLEGDITMMRWCNVVYMLPEWEHSAGALAEYMAAKLFNKPIVKSNRELNDWMRNLNYSM